LTVGQNLYLGKISGQLPITAIPTLGPGEGGKHQYHRDFYNPVFTYPIEKITNQLALRIRNYMNVMDPAIVNALDLNKPEHDVEYFCIVQKLSHSKKCTKEKVHLVAATAIMFRLCLYATC
jgi:hypothetical protein